MLPRHNPNVSGPYLPTYTGKLANISTHVRGGLARRDEQPQHKQKAHNQMSNINLTITHRVPHFPDEDSKLRATALQVRRGGNCPNSLEVLAQLVAAGPQQQLPLKLHMVSCLPGAGTVATRKILSSFGNISSNGDGGGGDGARCEIDFSRCLYREGYEEPASSYIIRSGATGSRTIVNFSELPEMTVGEFEAIADAFTTEHGDEDECWWHFEVGAGKKIRSLTMDPPSLSLLVLSRSTEGVCCVLCCVVALLLTPKTRADFQRQRSVASATCAGLRRGARSAWRLRSLAGKAWSSLPPRPTSSFTREAGLRAEDTRLRKLVSEPRRHHRQRRRLCPSPLGACCSLLTRRGNLQKLNHVVHVGRTGRRASCAPKWRVHPPSCSSIWGEDISGRVSGHPSPVCGWWSTSRALL
jgi:hypothetical protein